MKKLFFILLAAIFVPLPAQSSIISTNNGTINCDGIICPAASVSCTVSNRTSADLMHYKYTRTCLDATGRIDENVEQELPNPYPGTSINSVTTIGGSSSVGTLNDEEKQKFKENFIEQEKQFASNLEDIIKKAFPTGFPFN